MATYTKYDTFIEKLCNKLVDIFGTTDTIKAILCSDAPAPTTDSTISDRTQVANGGGYVTGGEDTQNDSTRTGGTVTETAVDIVWTATTGFGPFSYVDQYDDTAAADDLINYWPYGSAVTLLAGETFTLDYGASWATLT